MANHVRATLKLLLILGGLGFQQTGLAKLALTCPPPTILTPGRLNCHSYFTVEIVNLQAFCEPTKELGSSMPFTDENEEVLETPNPEEAIEALPTSTYHCGASYKTHFSSSATFFADLPRNCELPKTDTTPSKYFCGVEPQNSMKDWSGMFVIAQPCSENAEDIKFFCKQKARLDIVNQIGKPIKNIQYDELEEYDYFFVSPNGTQCCK